MIYRAAYERKSVPQTKQRRESEILHFQCDVEKPPRDKIVALIKRRSGDDFMESRGCFPRVRFFL